MSKKMVDELLTKIGAFLGCDAECFRESVERRLRFCRNGEVILSLLRDTETGESCAILGDISQVLSNDTHTTSRSLSDFFATKFYNGTRGL